MSGENINKQSKDIKPWELDDNTIVTFRKEKCTLKEAIDMCHPGESIEGLDIIQFDALLARFEKERNKEFQRSIDRRYGNWRFILFDV